MNFEFKKLDSNCNLNELEKLIDCNGWLAEQVLVVFDFDMTLSFLPVITTKTGKLVRSIKAELRGGDKSLEALCRLKESGARFAILTAKVDSPQGAETIVAKLKNLGIAHLFNIENNENDEINEHIKKLSLQSSIRMAACGDVVASGHNKPESFLIWANANTKSLQKRTKLIYVEDCADHVVNFEKSIGSNLSLKNNNNDTDNNESANSSFLSSESTLKQFTDALLLWWPPPIVKGFETREIHSKQALEILETKISKSISTQNNNKI